MGEMMKDGTRPTETSPVTPTARKGAVAMNGDNNRCLDCEISVRRAMHAEHVQRQRVVLAEHTHRVQCRCHLVRAGYHRQDG
jgi:hypothetical protein